LNQVKFPSDAVIIVIIEAEKRRANHARKTPPKAKAFVRPAPNGGNASFPKQQRTSAMKGSACKIGKKKEEGVTTNENGQQHHAIMKLGCFGEHYNGGHVANTSVS